jgi:hypothetical protein
MSNLATKFEQFKQKIELTDNERSNIISSHKHMRENILQRAPYVYKTFLTGSYKKNSAKTC